MLVFLNFILSNCEHQSATESHRMHQSDYCLAFFLSTTSVSISLESVCNFAVKKAYPKKKKNIMCAGKQCVNTVGGGFALRENCPIH